MLPKIGSKGMVGVACIERETGIALCGRDIRASEYAFSDAGHAVRHYENSDTIRACPSCVAVYKDKVSKAGAAPAGAVRGLENNK